MNSTMLVAGLHCLNTVLCPPHSVIITPEILQQPNMVFIYRTEIDSMDRRASSIVRYIRFADG